MEQIVDESALAVRALRHADRPFEYSSWAEVTRVERKGTTYRCYNIQYPGQNHDSYREREHEAFAQLAAIASRPLGLSGLCQWVEVGVHEGPPERGQGPTSWAIEEDFDGFDVVDAWKRAAHVRPHDIDLAWRHPGVMENDNYSTTTIDRAGQSATHIRKGPWAPNSPIVHPSPSRHRTVCIRQAPIAAHLAARVIVEAGHIVARLHAASIVHGMLTTEAIAITRSGRVVVHRVGTYQCRLRGAMYTGSGSPGRFYSDLAPEQLATNSVTVDSDVFQLASALYELLAFSPAWRRATSFSSMDALAKETLPPISTIHPEASPLDAIISLALSPDPDARPTLLEFIAAVDSSFPAEPDDANKLALIVLDAASWVGNVSSQGGVPM